MTTTFRRRKDGPKRACNAYGYFIQDQYARISIKLDTTVQKVIFKALCEKWHEMTLTDQLQYYNSAQLDRDRYQRERDVWIKLYRKPKPPKSQRPKKDPNIPKRTRNSYLFYMKATLRQVQLEKPHLNHLDHCHVIARRWHALSDESKEKYREMTQNDKRRYAQELKLYRMQKIEENKLARKERSEARKLAREQANQQPPQQEAEPVPQPQAPQPAAPEQPQPQVAQPQQQAGRVRPQPQEVEPQQQAVAPIQPQQQDAPQRPNAFYNLNPRHLNP